MPDDSGQRPAETALPPTPTRRDLIVFGLLMLTQLVASLDNQIVATALPTIIGELGRPEHFGWLVSAYVLAQCVVMPIYGKLGDLLGRKVVMLVALGAFSFGSVLCALSWSIETLIAARILQGLGNGGLLVLVLALSADLFEPRLRARFQGYLSFVFVFGSFVGPTLGGILTETLGWRSIFLVTIPLACTAAWGFVRFLPRRARRPDPVIDYAGALILALTVTAVIVWVDSARIFGGFASAQSLGLAAAILCLTPLWVGIEKRSAEPVVSMTLLGERSFALLSVATICNGAVSIGLINYHAYFLQMGIGLSPATAGLFFIAITLGVSAGALTTGRLLSRGVHFTTPLRVSLALIAVSLSLLAWSPGHVPVMLLPILFVFQGVCMGLSMNALVLGAQISAPQEDVGSATGAITLVRTIGGAVGIAIYGTIIAQGVSGLLSKTGSGAAQMTPARLDGLSAAARAEVTGAYAQSFSVLYLAAAAIAIVGLVAALSIRRPE